MNVEDLFGGGGIDEADAESEEDDADEGSEGDDGAFCPSLLFWSDCFLTSKFIDR